MSENCTARIKNDYSDEHCVLEVGHVDPEYGTDHAGPKHPVMGRLRWNDSAHGAVAHQPAVSEATDLDTSDRDAVADALAAEWHRRHQRLEELTDSKGPEAQVAIVEHVRGELVGLRGALGVLLGGDVQGGTADLLGWSYYQEWRRRQEGGR